MVRVFTSFVTGGPWLADGAQGAALAASAAAASAFGVFCWLEVTGFDFVLFFIFLCFVLHISFQLFSVCVAWWRRTQLMCTRDALLCNQVIRTNQFIFSVLTPLIAESPGGAFFLFFGTLTLAFYYHYPYQVWQDLVV